MPRLGTHPPALICRFGHSQRWLHITTQFSNFQSFYRRTAAEAWLPRAGFRSALVSEINLALREENLLLALVGLALSFWEAT